MNPRSRSAGFSLVEVAVAIGIATFCLLILAGFLSQGITTMQTSTQESIMANLATQVAADLRATPAGATTSPFYKITLSSTGGPSTMSAPTSIYLLSDGSAVTQSNANYCVTIGMMPPASGPGATTVRIVITWPPQAANPANQWPTTFSGSYEMMLALNRN